MSEQSIDCRSEEGVTVGLIDTIMAAANALKGRSLDHPAIAEALKDLGQSAELRELVLRGLSLFPGFREAALKSWGLRHEQISRTYEINELEIAMQPRSSASPRAPQGKPAVDTTGTGDQ